MTASWRLARRALLKWPAYLVGVVLLAGCVAAAEHPHGSDGCSAARRSPPLRNTYERVLTGVWHSSDTADGAASGTLVLRRDRKVRLAPARQGAIALRPLEGTWNATAQTLHIEIPDRGGADLLYTLTRHGRILNVTYQNGVRQRFRRQLAQPAGKRRT
jgi:hypothetical protein